MVDALYDVKRRWEVLGRGVVLDFLFRPECRLTHLVWADIFWLYAPTLVQLTQMVSDVVQALHFVGLELNLEEASWISTSATALPLRLAIPALAVDRVIPRASQITMLGTIVTPNHRTATTMHYRIEKSWEAFWRCRGILMNPNMPRGLKLKFLHRLISPTLFWGSGSWIPSRRDLQTLRSLQLRMSRVALRMPRRAHEANVWDYYKRLAGVTRRWMFLENIP